VRVLLISYDNGSHIPFFPLNLAYIAGELKKYGIKTNIWQQDIHHYPDGRLTTHLDNNYYDIVGLGFVAGYYQYRKAKSISRAIVRSKLKPSIFVIGGHGPAAEPEYFMAKTQADCVVVGEGEDALTKIIQGDFKRGLPLVAEPRGSADDYSWPAYDLFPIDIYRLCRFPNSQPAEFAMPVLSGRGCPYRCTFCYRMDDTFRPRSAGAICEEVEYLKSVYGISHFQFADELLMSSKARSVELAEALMPLKIKWDCNGRLNHATHEVLKVMKQAGCNYINYGIEALDDKVLAKMKKGLTVSQIENGISATIKVGLTPGLNFMWGNYGDTVLTLQKAVRFLKKYDGVAELRTIRPVTPYPGSALYRRAVDNGLLSGPEDFYERRHTNSDLFTVSFMDGIPPREGDLHLMAANKELVNAYYERCARRTNLHAELFYKRQIPAEHFRGFRAV